ALHSRLLSCLNTHPSAFFTLSLHDALPISRDHTCCGVRSPPSGSDPAMEPAFRRIDHGVARAVAVVIREATVPGDSRCMACVRRSEEHTSELQSRFDLVCRLLLEKKKHLHR